MRRIMIYIYKFIDFISKAFNKLFIVPGLKFSLGKCGYKVKISHNINFKYPNNIFIGNNSQIGPCCLFWTTRANIIIGNNVLIGPYVTIITGNHRTNIVGKYISEVKDEDKMEKDDEDVVIKDDVWIGANVTILKGVTISEGCIIAAGSVVTKSTIPYGIYAGNPAKRVKERFNKEQIEEHLYLLKNKNVSVK